MNASAWLELASEQPNPESFFYIFPFFGRQLKLPLAQNEFTPQRTFASLNLYYTGEEPRHWGSQGPAMEIASRLITLAVPGELVGSENDMEYVTHRNWDYHEDTLSELVPGVLGFEPHRRNQIDPHSLFKRAAIGPNDYALMCYPDALVQKFPFPPGLPEYNAVTARYIFCAQLFQLRPSLEIGRLFEIDRSDQLVVGLDYSTGFAIQHLIENLASVDPSSLRFELGRILSFVREYRAISGRKYFFNSVYVQAADGKFTAFDAAPGIPKPAESFVTQLITSRYTRAVTTLS